ncbi:M14 family metallopeptidase [Aliifodinibius sp. S!AR15-10]|uniref:M14 family metallopeptidase n=1 Tax=Aliifodinibius sp. S!AR15-10 TaxID=2950437 RepID=UPI00285FF245|nr:M14 family metallopeptidase [Aliifodinibius sp. S!AR15-10]MDR8392881.1 M14 family metallopeptidase [Aliifodinibius sp. S!AR15-10]
MKRKSIFSALIAILFISTTTAAQETLQSPEQYLGYELGEQWTPHHKVIGYFKHIAAESPMVEWQQYGTSNEGRELIYVTVSTEENIARKEEIRTNNLKRTGLLAGEPTQDSTAIVWMSYNVHGNEASSSEAAMKTLYELVRPGNQQPRWWLQNTMVIMDPTLNPDGRERYVHWYKATAREEANPHPHAREHHEPWPGGRTNHYYFDLNRDWAWLTQKESRQRNEIYQQWLPHVHVDFHEQGHNSPYYFAPAAEPFHKAITDWQREFQHTIGENHARYFDQNNWRYFTREIFDLFYPSYGDTYPIFNGSIGMTYEQAGQVGLKIIQVEGDTLTLHDRLIHHFTTGMSTVEVVSQHAEQIVSEFTEYYRKSRENPAGHYKTYVIKGDNDPDKIRSLLQLLESHNVQYGKAPRTGTYSGFNYNTGQDEQVEITTNDYLVSAYQPKSVLARIFFEPQPELSDSVTYDITAWEQHYAFGLDGYALTERLNPVSAGLPNPNIENNITGKPYAYLAEWHTVADMQLLAALLKKGVTIHVASQHFITNGVTYQPGTLVITRNENEQMGTQFDKVVQETATEFGQQLHPVSTGLMDSGPDLGSGAMRFVEAPNIALIAGNGTSANNVGEIWHFFDRQIDYPVTLIDTDYFSGVNLNRYDVLILPDGSYEDILNEDRFAAIKDWILDGGRLIVLQGANALLSGKEEFGLKAKEDTEVERSGFNYSSFNQHQRERISEANNGSIFKIAMDPSHPLGYGYDDFYFSLKLDTQAYDFIEEGWNVGVANAGAHVSGFVGSEAEKDLENTLAFGTQELGEGTVVYMIDNPLFRAFWPSGKLLFGNAVFMVGNRK